MDKNIIGVKTEEFVVIKPDSTFGKNPLIRSHTVIYAGNKIGNNFQTGHGVLIRENNTIGDHVSVGSHSVIEHDVTIGDNCRIHSNVFIPEFSVLERNSWIGPCVVLTNAKYPRSKNVKQNLIGVKICENAKIGAGAVILPGIRIGKNALVGAGSVVTKDVLDNQVVAGNPAKVIKSILEIKDYEEANI
ncbi:N-acetyltransferase [Candidatus Daviesbacteria bacterium]|nr:N-acetyltransferase [Candidatus Daviesbacteria bacterium]